MVTYEKRRRATLFAPFHTCSTRIGNHVLEARMHSPFFVQTGCHSLRSARARLYCPSWALQVCKIALSTNLGPSLHATKEHGSITPLCKHGYKTLQKWCVEHVILGIYPFPVVFSKDVWLVQEGYICCVAFSKAACPSRTLKLQRSTVVLPLFEAWPQSLSENGM